MREIMVALRALGAQRRKLAVLAVRQQLMREIVQRDAERDAKVTA